MATRIAILDDYQNQALHSANWDSLDDVEIVTFDKHLKSEAVLADAISHFDVVVAMRERTPFPATLLARLPRLRLLITTGMRNAAIDVDAARRHGITVCGTRMTTYAAFEHTWALILALAKNIPREDRFMHEGGWQAATNIGLRARTLGVLGLGKLGAQVAAIGNAFGMEVIAWSENLTEDRAAEVGAKLVDRSTLFSEADILTIHLVLSERTRGLVSREDFGVMKRTAFLVNTSRGPIVDEDALVQALQDGTIAGAALDVYDTEPLPEHHPLRSLDNALLTGHTGYVIEEMYQIAYGDAVKAIRAWTNGAPVNVLADAAS